MGSGQYDARRRDLTRTHHRGTLRAKIVQDHKSVVGKSLHDPGPQVGGIRAAEAGRVEEDQSTERRQPFKESGAFWRFPDEVDREFRAGEQDHVDRS
jgi:hypothetical protein